MGCSAGARFAAGVAAHPSAKIAWRSPSRRRHCHISRLLGSTLPREYHGIDPMRPWKHQVRRAASRGNPFATGLGRLPGASLTAASLAIALFFGLTVAAGAQGELRALIQSVVAEDRSNAGLTVIVLKTADQKSKLMRVVAPLGVLLPSGLGLKLDNQDVGRAGFVRCLPNGCVAEVVMDEKLLGQLRSAKTATFIIFETPEEGIGFPLSLNGLGEGYDKLP